MFEEMIEGKVHRKLLHRKLQGNHTSMETEMERKSKVRKAQGRSKSLLKF